jgi:hypothetical protein
LIRIVNYFLLHLSLFFFYSCANQLPPSGGPDDVTPPVIIRTAPSDQSINFTGSIIRIEFDDYIDRRSFQENFRIVPKPPGEISFDWSSRSVEIGFSRPLERNRTYIVTVGNGVRDLYGNAIQEPLQFAFSTGMQLDEGRITGTVITGDPGKTVVLAFLKTGRTENELNPEDNRADYSAGVTQEGSYTFTNLSQGEYRLFAIKDENNNELYDRYLEEIAVTYKDPLITSSGNIESNINFLLTDFDIDITSINFLENLKPATGNFVYTNYFDQTDPVAKDHRFYFYFKSSPFSKEEILRGISLADTAAGQEFRLVYNWVNDSLLEAFAIEDLPQGSMLNLKVELEGHGIDFASNESITVAGVNDYSDISGEIRMDTPVSDPVVINLINKVNYNKFSLTKDSGGAFRFENVPPGEYIIFAFIYSNRNNIFDKGSYFPFSHSERFAVYNAELRARARWNVEDIVLVFP